MGGIARRAFFFCAIMPAFGMHVPQIAVSDGGNRQSLANIEIEAK